MARTFANAEMFHLRAQHDTYFAMRCRYRDTTTVSSRQRCHPEERGISSFRRVSWPTTTKFPATCSASE
jgi:hypothetical protein